MVAETPQGTGPSCWPPEAASQGGWGRGRGGGGAGPCFGGRVAGGPPLPGGGGGGGGSDLSQRSPPATRGAHHPHGKGPSSPLGRLRPDTLSWRTGGGTRSRHSGVWGPRRRGGRGVLGRRPAHSPQLPAPSWVLLPRAKPTLTLGVLAGAGPHPEAQQTPIPEDLRAPGPRQPGARAPQTTLSKPFLEDRWPLPPTSPAWGGRSMLGTQAGSPPTRWLSQPGAGVQSPLRGRGVQTCCPVTPNTRPPADRPPKAQVGDPTLADAPQAKVPGRGGQGPCPSTSQSVEGTGWGQETPPGQSRPPPPCEASSRPAWGA